MTFRSKHSGVKGIVFGVNGVIFHCLNEGFVYIRVPTGRKKKAKKAELLLRKSYGASHFFTLLFPFSMAWLSPAGFFNLKSHTTCFCIFVLSKKKQSHTTAERHLMVGAKMFLHSPSAAVVASEGRLSSGLRADLILFHF